MDLDLQTETGYVFYLLLNTDPDHRPMNRIRNPATQVVSECNSVGNKKPITRTNQVPEIKGIQRESDTCNNFVGSHKKSSSTIGQAIKRGGVKARSNRIFSKLMQINDYAFTTDSNSIFSYITLTKQTISMIYI